MVKTVTALPLAQGTSGNAAVQGLEPGRELKAKVEANLPGGVIRLAAADARIDLRVPAPLPVGAEVTITVSGSKQQPAIQITTSGAAEPARPSGQLLQPQPGNPPGGASAQPAGQPPAAVSSSIPRSDPALVHLVQTLGGSPQAAVGTVTSGGAPSPSPAPVPAAPPAQQAAGVPQGTFTAAGQPAAVPVAGQQGPTVPATGTNIAPTVPAPGTPPQPAPAAGAPTVSAAPGAVPQAAAPAGNAPAASPGNVPPAGGHVPAAGQPGAPVLPAAASPSTAPQPPAQPAAAPPPTVTSAPPAPLSAGGGQTAPGPATAPLPGTPNLQSPAPASQPGAPAQIRTGPVQVAGGNVSLPAQPVSGAGPQGVPTSASPDQAPPAAAGLAEKPAGPPPSPGPSGPAVQASANTSLQGGQGAPATVPGAARMSGQQAPPTGAAPVQNTAPQAAGPAGAPSGAAPGGTARTDLSFSRAIPAQPYPAPAGPPVSAGGVAVSGLQNPAQQVAAVLRQPLAEQQAGFGAVFAQVSSLMTAQAAGKVSLPDPVVKAMQQILGLRLNSAQGLTGKDVQQAVRLSGQFREAQAMRPGSGSQPLPDLKSALLSLKALLQQLGAEAQVSRPAGQPPVPSRHGAPQGQAQQGGSGYVAGSTPQNLQSLLQETDSTLARMRLTQFVNSGLLSDEGPRAASRPMDIVLELPVALGHETAVMQMQVGRDGGGRDGDEEQEPAWRLRFALDLTATGPLEAAISLRGGGTYASLWIDRKETYDSLNAVRESLETAFADAGLDLQELRLVRGLPPKTAARFGALVDRQS